MPDNNRYTLLAGWLVDGSGGPVRERVCIQVHDGCIERMDCFGEDLRAEADRDFSGDTVIPCLVDTHVHLFMSGSGDPAVRTRQLEADFCEVRPQIEARLQRHMSCGVMAVRDGGDSRGHALRFRREILPERFSGVAVCAAGKAWRRSGRYGRLIGRSPAAGTSLAESIAGADPLPDHVKIVNSGLNSLVVFGKTTPAQFSKEELENAVREAKARGLKVMVHANGAEAVRGAVEAGCHSIEHGFFMGTDNLKKMAERRTVWVPTAITMKAYAEGLSGKSKEPIGAEKNLEHQLEQLRIAKEVGVCVAVGSDAGSLHVHHGSGCVEEMKLFMAAGYSCQEAVRCATVRGARLIGIDHAGRRLSPGQPASFLVCPGKPAQLPDSLYRLKAVYVQGRQIPRNEGG